MTKSADAFRTISEVAEWLGVQTHVLRFWESKFTQVKPVKRAGGRRYYRPADMLLLGGIRKLLHEDGLTIKGVQKILREEGMAHVADMSPPLDAETDAQLDADLTARMDQDVEQPPIEAEIVSFSTAPAPAAAEPAEEAAPAEQEASPPADDPQGSPRPLPAFLRTPAPPSGPGEGNTSDHQDLPYPPFSEDVPAAAPETAEESTEDAAPALAEEEPDALIEEPDAIAPVETPPEPVDTHIEEQADTPTLFDDAPVEHDARSPDNDLPLEPSLNLETEDESADTIEPVEAQEPEFGAEPVQVAAFEPEEPATPDSSAEEDIAASTEPVAQQDDDAPAPVGTGLPSFLTGHRDVGEETTEPEPEQPARPSPRVVDVPDDPDPNTISVAPSALGKSARITHLSDAQREMIRPLLAQLTALRDQMANNRREPR